VEVADDIEDAVDYRDRLLEARDDLDYEIDGAVIKVDARDAREELGRTARHDRWAFAYKFPARAEVTPIVDVAVQVGRTGRLTPVALLEPVDVGGVTVSRASLHNPEEIEAKNVNVGDTVRVQRAGDVIPYVEEVVEKDSEGHYEMPETCPVCDSPVERDGPIAFVPVDSAVTPSSGVRSSTTPATTALTSRGSARRASASSSTPACSSPSRTSTNSSARTCWRSRGGGETSAENLLSEIEASRDPPLSDFISALGVLASGRRRPESSPASSAASRISARSPKPTPSDSRGRRRRRRDGRRDDTRLFTSEANADVVDGVLEHVSPQDVDIDTGGDELAGLTFVFTGSLEEMTRGDAQELVETHGANATGSVSGNTDYLVTGDNPGATKQADARDNDVPILDESEFRALLEDEGIDHG